MRHILKIQIDAPNIIFKKYLSDHNTALKSASQKKTASEWNKLHLDKLNIHHSNSLVSNDIHTFTKCNTHTTIKYFYFVPKLLFWLWRKPPQQYLVTIKLTKNNLCIFLFVYYGCLFAVYNFYENVKFSCQDYVLWLVQII